jgi:hypothetical protein
MALVPNLFLLIHFPWVNVWWLDELRSNGISNLTRTGVGGECVWERLEETKARLI